MGERKERTKWKNTNHVKRQQNVTRGNNNENKGKIQKEKWSDKEIAVPLVTINKRIQLQVASYQAEEQFLSQIFILFDVQRQIVINKLRVLGY